MLQLLLVAALCAVAAAACGEQGSSGPLAGGGATPAPPAATTATAPAAPATATQPPPSRTGPARAAIATRPPGYQRALVGIERTTALRSRPGGRVLARVRPKTGFNSPAVLPVVRERDGWYGVISTALPNGRIGWVSARAPLRHYVTPYRIDVSLRHRRVVVRRGDDVIERFRVAVGAPATPTPTGRFAVTDTLITETRSGPYGCCILALSAHQSRTPQGWGGGDRIAIHATDKPSTIGSAASLGCLRAPAGVMRRLIQLVPLGTVVTIRR
jgi:lipoprotein-anchoring transpeptidase ErfK/SrfK